MSLAAVTSSSLRRHLFVASTGYKTVINHLLQHYQVDRYVTQVLTPAVLGRQEGLGLGGEKQDLIAWGLEHYNGKKALLIDASEKDVESATKSGHLAHLVDYRKGLTKEDTEAILRLVDTHPEVDAVFLNTDMTVFEEHATAQYIYALNNQNARGLESPLTKLAEGVRPLLKALKKDSQATATTTESA